MCTYSSNKISLSTRIRATPLSLSPPYPQTLHLAVVTVVGGSQQVLKSYITMDDDDVDFVKKYILPVCYTLHCADTATNSMYFWLMMYICTLTCVWNGFHCKWYRQDVRRESIIKLLYRNFKIQYLNTLKSSSSTCKVTKKKGADTLN